MLVCLPLVLSSPKVMPVSAAENEEDIPITILNYHKVDNMNIALSVLPEDFDRQMAYLKENGYFSYIVPYTWMTIGQHFELRKFLLERNIYEIVDDPLDFS